MNTTNKTRKRIHELMVKNNVDMVELPAKLGLKLGIEYVTLKGKSNICGINYDEEYVPIADENVEGILEYVRVEFNDMHLYELTEEQVEQLRKEVVFGSVYMADYENSLGVPEKEVANYADGYLEAKENPEEYGDYETFYDYIQSVEWID